MDLTQLQYFLAVADHGGFSHLRVIDDVVAALDGAGRSSFQLLQAREMEGGVTPVYYYVFDLLQAEGRSLIEAPLELRKQALEQLCADAAEAIRYSGEIGGDPACQYCCCLIHR